MERTPRLRWQDIDNIASVWAEQFFQSPAYWRISDRPAFSILNILDFTRHYGFFTFTTIILRIRQVIRSVIGCDPYIIGLASRISDRNLFLANHLPIDAVTGYALLPTWESSPIQQYEELIETRVEEWHSFQKQLRVPFFPVASVGYDATVRGEHVASIHDNNRFPWAPVVVGVTAGKFGHFLDRALSFNAEHHPELNVVFIHAWNEWTESSVIEPSDRFGSSFLLEIRTRQDRLQARVINPAMEDSWGSPAHSLGNSIDLRGRHDIKG